MDNAEARFITWTHPKNHSEGKLKSASLNGSTSSTDPTDAYSKFIWDLAQKFTNSDEEARAAVEEMRSDIRHCAEDGVAAVTNEDRLISEIAWRRLKKFLE